MASRAMTIAARVELWAAAIESCTISVCKEDGMWIAIAGTRMALKAGFNSRTPTGTVRTSVPAGRQLAVAWERATAGQMPGPWKTLTSRSAGGTFAARGLRRRPRAASSMLRTRLRTAREPRAGVLVEQRARSASLRGLGPDPLRLRTSLRALARGRLPTRLRAGEELVVDPLVPARPGHATVRTVAMRQLCSVEPSSARTRSAD